jgi:hypothetical protein
MRAMGALRHFAGVRGRRSVAVLGQSPGSILQAWKFSLSCDAFADPIEGQNDRASRCPVRPIKAGYVPRRRMN